MSNRFYNRSHAGKLLAERLTAYADLPGVVVLALPRGGVPVAFQVARNLHAPLDVFVVRKLGVPGREELAMGAIATGGVRVINQQVVESLRVPQDVIEAVVRREQCELERREALYRKDQPACSVQGRTVLLVDDGVATGSTMCAAVKALRQSGASHIVVAVPTGSNEALHDLRREADDVIVVISPDTFQSVGQWYEDFAQTTDDEVQELLALRRHQSGSGAPGELSG